MKLQDATPTLGRSMPPREVSLPLSRQDPAQHRQGQWFMVGGGLLLGTLGIFIEEAGQPALTAVWFRCFFGLLALTLWFAVSSRWSELPLAAPGVLISCHQP